EDGIRDRNVTGVQTCALPILKYIYFRGFSSCHSATYYSSDNTVFFSHIGIAAFFNICCNFVRIVPVFHCLLLKLTAHLPFDSLRSEERRVGKECRSWWAAAR